MSTYTEENHDWDCTESADQSRGDVIYIQMLRLLIHKHDIHLNFLNFSHQCFIVFILKY